MKKFILVILSVMIAAATLFTACAKPTTDSGVSTGSSADESDAQSAISSENGDFSVDDKLSTVQSESLTESQISSEDSTDSSEETTEDSTEDTSDVVAVVTPVKPDDTSDNVPDNNSSVADVSVAPSPVIDPVESTEDNTSEEHVHSYKFSYTESHNPTCTEDGINVYKCACGDSYTEPSGAKATGHAWTTWDIDAESMTATRTCQFSRCRQTETQDIVVIDNVDEFAEEACTYFIELLNEERAKLGAPALSTAPIAHEMAMVRANELTVLFSHQRPNYIEGIGSDSATIYYEYKYNPADTGYYGRTGESCYMPFSSSEDIMEGGFSCVNSAYDLALHCLNTFKSGANRTGHWADLTNPEYTGVGVGFAISAYGTFSTADKNGSFSSYNPVHAEYTYELAILTMDKTYG